MQYKVVVWIVCFPGTQFDISPSEFCFCSQVARVVIAISIERGVILEINYTYIDS